jgi:uncharacterized membrane protein YtjA (UPF0391 family)
VAGGAAVAVPRGSTSEICSLTAVIFNVSATGTIVFHPDYFSSKRRASGARTGRTEVRVMLGWVVTFLIIALIAGVLGFGGVAGASIEIAKLIFFIAVVLFLVSAIVGLARGRTRV